jgi:hypothetical protein
MPEPIVRDDVEAGRLVVAHQPAGFRSFTQRIGRRESMKRRQLDQLDTPDVEECESSHEQRVGPLVSQHVENGINLTAGFSVEDLDLQSDGASSRFHVSQGCRGIRGVSRIDQHSNASSPWHELTQKFQPLCFQLVGEQIDARQVTAWSGEAPDKTKPRRVLSNQEDDWDGRRVAAFAANAAGGPPVVTITATCRRTRSATSAGKRSIRFSAQR